jgi:hypothetical protein
MSAPEGAITDREILENSILLGMEFWAWDTILHRAQNLGKLNLEPTEKGMLVVPHKTHSFYLAWAHIEDPSYRPELHAKGFQDSFYYLFDNEEQPKTVEMRHWLQTSKRIGL